MQLLCQNSTRAISMPKVIPCQKDICTLLGKSCAKKIKIIKNFMSTTARMYTNIRKTPNCTYVHATTLLYVRPLLYACQTTYRRTIQTYTPNPVGIHNTTVNTCSGENRNKKRLIGIRLSI